MRDAIERLHREIDATREAVQAWPRAAQVAASERLLAEAPLFDVEAAASCNIHCDFCPRLEMGRPARIMTPGVFERVLAFLPDDAVVMFSGLGDALMNRHLESYVAKLQERGISSCVITNGLLLTPARQASLIDAGIAQFQISYHSTTPAAYDPIIVRGGDLERLDRHLAHLAANRPREVRARLNFVLTPGNEAELERAQRRAEALGLELFVRRLHSRGGSIDSHRGGSCGGGCGIFASVTFITAQGDVLSCVNDVEGDSRMGNVAELRWPQLRALKHEVVREDRWFPACAGCDDDYRWVLLKNGSVDGGTS